MSQIKIPTSAGKVYLLFSNSRELTMFIEEIREGVETVQCAPKKPLAPLADLLVTFMLSG